MSFLWRPDARGDRRGARRHRSHRGARLGKSSRASSRPACRVSDTSDTPPRPMTRERWERLAPLVDAVLEQPAARRRAYIAEIADGDAALANDLTRFVDAYGSTEARQVDGSIFEAAA